MDSPPLRETPESWIWPLTMAEFRRDHWFQQPFVQHRGAHAVGSYGTLEPCSEDNEEWFVSLGGEPRVPICVNGETVASATMPHKEALKFYRTGQNIYVMNPSLFKASTRALADVLAVPVTQTGSSVHISKRGGYTPLHWDAADTFVIQIHGTKIWRQACNRSAPQPMDHWGFGMRMPFHIRDYASGEVRKSDVLAESQEIVATPGTVIYLPRGHWHTTEIQEDSVSVHFHYKTVTWVDAVQIAIRRELSRKAQWRKAAFGFGSNPSERRRAVVELTGLLAGLADTIAGLDVSDVIGPINDLPNTDDGDSSIYKRIALSALGIESSGANGSRVVRFVLAHPLHEAIHEFEVPEDFVSVCLWINSRSLADHFTLDDIVRLGLSRTEARRMLSTLVEVGMIERVTTPHLGFS